MIRRLMLVVVIPIVFGYSLGALVSGCGSTFTELESEAAMGDASAKLALCRADGRFASINQKSNGEAVDIYDVCRKGIR